MPLLGFGVYQNYTTHVSVSEAFRAGYRSVPTAVRSYRHLIGGTIRVYLRRHVDSAQVYKNEAEVGTAFRASGLRRDEVFLSTSSP